MGDPQGQPEEEGPWQKYQSASSSDDGPWTKYSSATTAPLIKTQATEAPEPSLLEKGWDAAKDVVKGAAKGFFHTAGVLGEHATPPYLSGSGIGGNNAPAIPIVPHGTAQQVGYTGEQLGEWFAPTGAEEHLASLLSKTGKAIPVAKIGAQALESGLRNKSQGGDFTTGAEAGAGGEILSQGLQKAAPIVAETALGVTNRMRGHGRTIGDAALNELKSVRPASLLQESGQKIKGLTGELESRAAAPMTPPASTAPAIKVLDDAIDTYTKRNSPFAEKLQNVKDQLSVNRTTGKAIPTLNSPSDILELKRGVGDLINSWAPGEQKGAKPIIQRVYGALDKELDRTVPGADKLNQRISSLIPVKQRASILANGASTPQRIMGRIARPTGALLGAGVGYHEAGIPGALAGLAIPELISSPSAQMFAARAMKSGAIPQLGKALSLQLDRPKQEDEDQRGRAIPQ